MKHANKDLPVLLLGDLNSRPDSNVVGYLTDENYKAVPYKKV